MNDEIVRYAVGLLCNTAIITYPGPVRIVLTHPSDIENVEKTYAKLTGKPAIEQLAYINSRSTKVFDEIFHALMRSVGVCYDGAIHGLYEPTAILDKLRPGWRELAQTSGASSSASSSSSSAEAEEEKK